MLIADAYRNYDKAWALAGKELILKGGAKSNHYANCSISHSFPRILDVIFIAGLITTVCVRENFVGLQQVKKSFKSLQATIKLERNKKEYIERVEEVFISPTLEKKTLMLFKPSLICAVFINPVIFICLIWVVGY